MTFYGELHNLFFHLSFSSFLSPLFTDGLVLGGLIPREGLGRGYSLCVGTANRAHILCLWLSDSWKLQTSGRDRPCLICAFESERSYLLTYTHKGNVDDELFSRLAIYISTRGLQKNLACAHDKLLYIYPPRGGLLLLGPREVSTINRSSVLFGSSPIAKVTELVLICLVPLIALCW